MAVAGAYASRLRAGEISTPVAILPSLAVETPRQNPAGETSWADRVVSFCHGLGVGDVSLDPKGALGKPDCGNARRQPGAVLVIVEVGFVEPVRVAVSADCESWIDIGTGQVRVNNFDLAEHGLSGRNFRQVKPTDGGGSAKSWRAGTPGVDIDAVGVRDTIPTE